MTSTERWLERALHDSSIRARALPAWKRELFEAIETNRNRLTRGTVNMTSTERRRKVLEVIEEAMEFEPPRPAGTCPHDEMLTQLRLKADDAADRIEALYAAEVQPPNTTSTHRILGEIRARLEAEIMPLDPEIQAIMDANRWDLYVTGDDEETEGATS